MFAQMGPGGTMRKASISANRHWPLMTLTERTGMLAAIEGGRIMNGRTAYGAGAALARLAGLLQAWANLAVGIVGDTDNAQNQGFFGVVVAALALAWAVRFTSEGMARAMVATAGIQAILGLMVATAPITAKVEPMGPMGVIAVSGFFIALWLASAALFHRSARGERATG
jgi:hypothetical protein